MAKASADGLGGELRTDAEIIRFPNCFGGGKNQLWKDAFEFINDLSLCGHSLYPGGKPA